MFRLIPAVLIAAVSLPAAVAQAADSEPKLDYRQRQSLKDAVYFLDQAGGITDQLEARTKDWKAGDAGIPIQTVDNYIASKDKAVQYLTNANNRLKDLPPAHSEVKPEVERAAAVKQRLTALETKLNEIHKSLSAVVRQGADPGYKADFDRLREITLMFGEPQVLETHPERAIEIARQMAAVKAERQRIAEKYGDLLKQDTAASRDMNGTLRHFDGIFGRFEQAAKAYASQAPGKINENVDEALKMGKEAVDGKKHLFFRETGGVNQRLAWAQTRLSVLAALAPDAPETAAAKTRIDTAREQVKQMRATLNDAIIAANTLPEETYQGDDKARLVEIVKAKWAESAAGAEAIRIGINSQTWRRDTRWEWNGRDAFQKVDKSRIQGFVVVKSSEGLATVHYVNLVKDHLANDQIKAYFLDDPKAEPDVVRKLLLKNVPAPLVSRLAGGPAPASQPARP